MVDKAGELVKAIEVAERLATLETLCQGIKEHLDDQKKQDEKLEKKIDKILDNDKGKLQRIAKTETKVKNIKATLWLFAVALVGAVVKTFL